MSFHLKNGRFTKRSINKKVINLKNQGVPDKRKNDIVVDN